MIPVRGMIQTVKGWLGKPIAGPETDPQRFFGTLFALPNPDPILREMGQAERVYASIAADPHVLGDLRSIRGNFRSHTYRISAGDDIDANSLKAAELCRNWLQRTPPNDICDWLEVMWQMSSAFLSGYRAHEMVMQSVDGAWLPQMVIDRPGRRVRFDAWGKPLLVSTGNMMGAPLDAPWQLIISRHMPSYDNPYGVAVLSAAFWAWTFKTGGWRYFVKYCERHGLPWPVGRYPAGTSDAEQDKLAEALESMLEAGYVVTQEGNGIELLVPTNSGSTLPQQALIELCNREISKALTGQAMVAELTGAGARAASETALKRQESIDDSVRDIAAQSMGQIFSWITLFNFGDGIAPPVLEFFQHENAGKDRADTYKVAADMGARPSKRAMLEELGIPEAEDDADALLPAGRAAPDSTASANVRPGGHLPAGQQAGTMPADQQAGAPRVDFSAVAGFQFAKAAGMTEDDAIELAAEAADQAIEDRMIAPVAEMLAEYERQGKTLQDFRTDLEDMVGVMDDEGLREVLDRALSYSILRGAATRVG